MQVFVRKQKLVAINWHYSFFKKVSNFFCHLYVRQSFKKKIEKMFENYLKNECCHLIDFIFYPLTLNFCFLTNTYMCDILWKKKKVFFSNFFKNWLLNMPFQSFFFCVAAYSLCIAIPNVQKLHCAKKYVFALNNFIFVLPIRLIFVTAMPCTLPCKNWTLMQM